MGCGPRDERDHFDRLLADVLGVVRVHADGRVQRRMGFSQRDRGFVAGQLAGTADDDDSFHPGFLGALDDRFHLGGVFRALNMSVAIDQSQTG